MTDAEISLPASVVKRIAKSALASRQVAGPEASKKNGQVAKDAIANLSQAAKVFISYVTAIAHDICKERSRSTVALQDVIQALEDLEFENFVAAVESKLAAGMPHSTFSSVKATMVSVVSINNGMKYADMRSGLNFLRCKVQHSDIGTATLAQRGPRLVLLDTAGCHHCSPVKQCLSA
jgi:histone H3/H4